MKLSFILLLIAFCQVQAATYAQTKVSINTHDMPIRKVFKELRKQTGYYFVYNEELLDKGKKVSVDMSNVSISEAMKEVLKGTGHRFEVDGDCVIILEESRINKIDKQQQKNEIKGKVLDKKGKPIPGVSVVIKGTNIGVSTNIDGKFNIKIPKQGMTLIFSFIGMKTQEIKINKQSNITVILEEEKKELEEVVVTGIFRKSKESFTGAATTVSRKEMKLFAGRNVLQTLNNIDPSLNIIPSNEFGSDPNRLPEIQLRGASSLPDIDALKNDTRAKVNTPLIVIDGFESTLQKLIDMNPEEVESVTILKDASSTAIYGSNGANGVIVVQTREPEPGKLRVTYNSQINIESPDLSSYNLTNAREKIEIERHLGYYEDHNDITNHLELLKRYDRIIRNINAGNDTDWLAKPTRGGIGHSHSLRLEGGDRAFRYSVNVRYNNIKGVMKGSERNTYNGDFNLRYVRKNLIARNSLNIGITKSENSPYGAFYEYTKLNPYWTPYDRYGNMVPEFELSNSVIGNEPNPLYDARLNIIDQRNSTNITNNTDIEWKPNKHWKINAKFSFSKTFNTSDNFLPAEHSSFKMIDDMSEKGSYDYTTGQGWNYQANITINYNRVFAEKHSIYCGLHYTLSENEDYSYTFKAIGFPYPSMSTLAAALDYKTGSKPQGNESTYRKVGLTSNLNYVYDNRYFVDLSYRIDGSSQFGTNKKFAPFYSLGTGWNLHNEKFINEHGFINVFKLKGSYGISGSLQFQPYQALTTYKFITDRSYFNGLGTTLLGIGNEDLEWQTTHKYNFGITLQLLHNRVALESNIYKEITNNQLSDMELPGANGFQSYKENSGEIQNKGIELRSTVYLIRNTERKLIWSVTGNIQYNRNTITKLSEVVKQRMAAHAENKDDAKTVNPNRIYREGESQNALHVVRSLGIDPASGQEIYLDRFGNPTFVYNTKDRVYVGERNPKYLGNVSTLVKYKDFTCNASFAYHFGGVLYNATLVSKVERADIKYNVDKRIYTGRWRKPGDVVAYKDLASNGTTYQSSRFVNDDKMFRCQNISLQYRLSNKWLQNNLGVRNMTLSFNTQDLFYLSNVKRERGTSYPFSHKYTFGLFAIF